MEKTRICKICGEEKPISDFYSCYAKKDWHRKECKQCTLLNCKEYASKHKNEKAEYLKKYNKENRERIRQQALKKQRHRLATEPLFRAKRNVRLSIWKAFNGNGQIREDRIVELVGCSPEELTNYLKKTWRDEYGIEWTNQDYNIDHITPLVIAKTEQEVKALCHYTNLRLVTPEDNFKKGLKERRNND